MSDIHDLARQIVADAWADSEPQSDVRKVLVTPASKITMRPVRWLWEGRIALGSLALLGGREGIGKSQIATTIAADITRGRLPGVNKGIPKSVVIAATEDAWEFTIVPRLAAAGADLDRVLRIEVQLVEGLTVPLVLPTDVEELRSVIVAEDVAMVALDPLISRLDAKLDSHKDGEVRIALEPLTAMFSETGCTGLGLIHVNKSGGSDPLSMLMASRAFPAVA